MGGRRTTQKTLANGRAADFHRFSRRVSRASASRASPASSASPRVRRSSTLPAADQAVADQLRTLSSGKYDRLLGGKSERTAVEAFYSGRSYAPLWITDGHVNDRAISAVAYLGHVDADGLDPADYPVADFKSSDPGTLAEAELRLTASTILYAHHASVGRVHWSRVSADISYDQKPPEPAGASRRQRSQSRGGGN